MHEESFMENIFQVINGVVSLMHAAFSKSALKNEYNSENIFITLYFIVQFSIQCALCTDASCDEIQENIKQYNSVLLQLAKSMSNLLLNNDVYEFIEDAVEHCMSRGKLLC